MVNSGYFTSLTRSFPTHSISSPERASHHPAPRDLSHSSTYPYLSINPSPPPHTNEISLFNLACYSPDVTRVRDESGLGCLHTRGEARRNGKSQPVKSAINPLLQTPHRLASSHKKHTYICSRLDYAPTSYFHQISTPFPTLRRQQSSKRCRPFRNGAACLGALRGGGERASERG
jgi:hypothetical protein